MGLRDDEFYAKTPHSQSFEGGVSMSYENGF